jgi:hypothetical protein
MLVVLRTKEPDHPMKSLFVLHQHIDYGVFSYFLFQLRVLPFFLLRFVGGLNQLTLG